MAGERLVEIPVDAGDVLGPAETRPVRGGHTRLVKLIPVLGKLLPCIWRSHQITQVLDAHGNPIPVNQCLLLVCTNPPTVLHAEIEVDAWTTFGEGPVEW